MLSAGAPQACLAQLEIQPTEKAWIRNKLWYYEGRPAAHAHTHTERTNRQTHSNPYGSDTPHAYVLCFSPACNTCTAGSWMYIIIGTCVHTRGPVQYTLHIYTQTFARAHNLRARQMERDNFLFTGCVSCCRPSSGAALCLCVYSN